MSAEEIKSLLDELSERLKSRDAQGAADLFNENALYSEPPRPQLQGRPAIAALFRAFFAQHYAVEFAFRRILIGEGEAAAEWTFSYARSSDGSRRHLDGISFIDTSSGRIQSWRGFSAQQR